MDYCHLLPSGSGTSMFLSWCVKASLILGTALAVNTISRRISASIRHLLMCAALLGTAALPLSSLLIPRWEALSLPASEVTDLSKTPLQSGTSAKTSRIETSPPTGSLSVSRASRPSSSWWRYLLPAVYLLGAGAMASRIARTLLQTRRLRKTARCAPETDRRFAQLASDAARRAQMSRPVKILLSSQVSVPMVTGLVRPVILLPEQATNWSGDSLSSVLLHEMAHIRRRDYLTSPLICFSGIWQWFNPLSWVVMKRCYVEREKACDDLVLATGVADTDYATHLLTVSRAATSSGWLMLAALTTEHRTGFESRLRDILDRSRSRTAATASRTWLVGLLTAAMVLPFASLAERPGQARLIAVTAAQKETVLATLRGLFDALSDGVDYDSTRATYLSAHYFDQPDLTMENRERGEWDTIRKKMTVSLYNRKVLFHPIATGDIKAIRAEDGKFSVSLLINVFNDAGIDSGVYFVRNLESIVEIVEEKGGLRISSIDGGLSLMRMDVNSPYGPIFLVWMKDMGSVITPYGPFIVKVIPESIRQENSYTLYLELEE